MDATRPAAEAERLRLAHLPTPLEPLGLAGQLLIYALLSKPTIQRLPILITGTPVCLVLRTMSRAASGSRSMLTSLNGTRRSLK
jgi:hypothetical protein